MERVKGIDAGFLYMETPTVHMHTLKVAVLESTPSGRFAYNQVKHELARQAEEVIGTVASSPLDRRRPLWELWFIEGLESGHLVILVKLHHCVADGTAAAHLLANVMETSAETIHAPAPTSTWSPEEIPSNLRLLRDAMRDHLGQLARLPGLLGRTARNTVKTTLKRRRMVTTPPLPLLDTPKTSINSALTARRNFATTALPLEAIKHIKDVVGVSVNDVLLGLVAGSLRSYLADRGELPARPLLAEVPTSTDPPGHPPRLSGNRVSNIFTSLATDTDDPIERLRTIHSITAAAKQLKASMGHDTYREWIEYAPPRPFAWSMRMFDDLREVLDPVRSSAALQKRARAR